MPRMILLTLFLLTTAFPYGIADAHAMQSGTGEIKVTVITESGTPVPEATVTFRAEGERLDRSACVTGPTGLCTLPVIDAPTDASGLIRGYLYLEDGNRPVIWPGEDLRITITTTSTGRIRPSADFIDSTKGTPTATPPTTVRPLTEGISTSTTALVHATIVTRTVMLTPTATLESVMSEKRDDTLSNPEDAWPIGFILPVVIGLGGLGWAIRQYRARQGTGS
jgi:hypothetical protein